jgi:hypothetical protein
MAENETRETCSISRCLSPAVHSEHGRVGHWYVTIFYCDEHARELQQGTPLGPIGVDTERLRVEPVGDKDTPQVTNRFPGIA